MTYIHIYTIKNNGNGNTQHHDADFIVGDCPRVKYPTDEHPLTISIICILLNTTRVTSPTNICIIVLFGQIEPWGRQVEYHGSKY